MSYLNCFTSLILSLKANLFSVYLCPNIPDNSREQWDTSCKSLFRKARFPREKKTTGANDHLKEKWVSFLWYLIVSKYSIAVVALYLLRNTGCFENEIENSGPSIQGNIHLGTD